MDLDWRSFLLLALLAVPWDSWAAQDDPVSSVMWEYHHARLLDGAPYVFDERIVVQVPPFAEDARQVPIQVDASAYDGEVVRILAWAELNPLPRIVDFEPGERVLPWLSIRIRIEQATPIRAAELTRDGLWHVGSTQIDAAGGGCTAPSVVRTQPGWEDHVGEVLGGRYPRSDGSRFTVLLSMYGSNYGSMFVMLEPFEERVRDPEKSGTVIMNKLRKTYHDQIRDAQTAVFGAPPA